MTAVAFLVAVLGLAPVAAAQGPASAPPSDATLAEQARLDEEMRALAARQQWKGADQLYRRLRDLEAQGADLTYAQHMLGTSVARSLGDVSAALERLERAALLGETDEVRGIQADLQSRFGAVRLEIEARAAGAWSLEMVPAPFAPDARAAVELANSRLQADRRFAGWLPAGSYRLGTAEFSVPAGPNEVLLAVSGSANSGRPAVATPAPAAAPDGPRAGLLLRAGGGYGAASAPPTDQVQPPAARGFAPVLGLGGTWGRGALELSGLLAWRAVVGASAEAGSQQVHLGTATALVGLRAGRAVLEAGPLYGVGAGRSVGAADTASALCGEGRCRSEELRGRVRGGGLEGGARLDLFDAGPLVGGAGLHAGGLSDGSRWYPWVTLSLVFRPGAPS